jgi:hypothetical protein
MHPHGGPFVLPTEGAVNLRILVDHALVEAFANSRASVTGMSPSLGAEYDPTATGVALFSTCPGLRAEAFVWRMASAPVAGNLTA